MYRKCPEAQEPLRKETDWFRLRYVAVWTVGYTTFVGAVALFFVGVFGSTPLTAAVYFPVMAVCATTFFFMYLSSAQLRYRSGAGFFEGLLGARADFAPANTEEAEEVLKKVRKSSSKERPTPVGGAWSNVLRMQTTDGPRIHTRKMVDKDVDNLKFGAGIEVMDVNKILRKQNLQLVNVPSYGCVSLGAWVATQGHGMTGRYFNHGPICVDAVVLHMETGIVTLDTPELLLQKFGSGAKNARKYLVTEVTLKGSPTLVPDGAVLREGRWLSTVKDAEWILSANAIGAVLFVGNSNTLALRWTLHSGSKTNQSGWLMDVGITMFAVVGYGLSDPKGRDRTQMLHDVPGFFHFYLSPVFILFLVLFGVMNAEIITSSIELTPDALYKVCSDLQTVYKRFNGRCEIRFTGRLTYFDLFAFSEKGASAVLDVLGRNGVEQAALHPGKFQLSQQLFCNAGIFLRTAHDIRL
jgi:hypothetical protein